MTLRPLIAMAAAGAICGAATLSISDAEVVQPYVGTIHGTPHDADTLRLDTATGESPTLRLHRADAPEVEWADHPGQPYGVEARDDLLAHWRGVVLTCTPIGSKSYQREVADCRGPDGTDLATWLVSRGDAWAEVAYGGKALLPAQEAAQKAKRGLWGLSAHPTPPWCWRTPTSKRCGGQGS